MFLPKTCCIICGEYINKAKYNLKTTYSEKSEVLLIKLIENYYKNICFLHCNICVDCYNLLNELDSVRYREQEILRQLKTHISKLEDSGPNIVNVKEENYLSDSVALSHALPIEHLEEDNGAASDAAFSNDEKDIQIPNIIELKGLPIKIKRVPSKNNHHIDLEVISQQKSKATGGRKKLEDNEKVFEQIQTSIQMDLSKHVQEYMNKCKPARDVLCEICGQNFKTKLGYENHMKKHGNVEDEMRLLTLNKVDHRADHNWFCNVCGKNFNLKVSLSRHLAIHTGETRYQCEQCGKNFLHHSSFNVHRKIHKGIRNYRCETCNHSFLTNSHLRRHLRCHLKEKKQVCETCGRKFAEYYNLKAHIKFCHKEIMGNIQPIQEEKTSVYYQVQENVLIKDESLIHIDDSSTAVLYTL